MTKYRVTFMETHKIEVEAADERAAVRAAVDAKDKAFDDNRDESDDDIEVDSNYEAPLVEVVAGNPVKSST